MYQANVHPEGLNLSLTEVPSICSAFLANIDEQKAATVTFRGQTYRIPPWSVSILPDCKNTAFNTAKVGLRRENVWNCLLEGYGSLFARHTCENAYC